MPEKAPRDAEVMCFVKSTPSSDPSNAQPVSQNEIAAVAGGSIRVQAGIENAVHNGLKPEEVGTFVRIMLKQGKTGESLWNDFDRHRGTKRDYNFAMFMREKISTSSQT